MARTYKPFTDYNGRAYKAGRAAFAAGLTTAANPYASAKTATAWQRGYFDAKDAAESAPSEQEG